MTLQEYFTREYAQLKIDHIVRASVFNGVVEIYIHPLGRDGQTTPVLIVEGNTVRPKFPEIVTDDHELARFADEGNPLRERR
jgi:hypothetical protein